MWAFLEKDFSQKQIRGNSVKKHSIKLLERRLKLNRCSYDKQALSYLLFLWFGRCLNSTPEVIISIKQRYNLICLC